MADKNVKLKNNNGDYLYPVNPKSLYNLGAYDTYVSNGDGTATITRKTGYLYLSPDYANEKYRRCYDDTSNKGNVTFLVGDSDGVASSEVSAVCNSLRDGHPWIGNDYHFWLGTDLTVALCLDNDSSHATKEFLLQWLSEHPTYIQYELATSYTETVIDNQPLSTLDQNGEEWLRNEWGKGLNLTEVVFKYTGQYANAYNVSRDVFKPNNVYTIDFDTKNTGAQIYFNETLFSNTVLNGHPDLNVTADGTHKHYVVQTLSSISYQLVLAKNRVANTGTNADGSSFYNWMITVGNNTYPYQPYNGGIVHEKDLKTASVNHANTADTITSTLPITNGGTGVNNKEEIPSSINVPSTYYHNILGKRDLNFEDDTEFLELHPYLGSLQVSSTDKHWYNLINIRHRGGAGDGNSYGAQIRIPFSENRIEYRRQNNGTYGDWIELAEISDIPTKLSDLEDDIGVGGDNINAGTVTSGGGFQAGTGANANDGNGVAIGYNVTAHEDRGVAIGNIAVATDGNAIAIGYNAQATDIRTISIGYSSRVSNGENSIAFGTSTYAFGTDCIAIGNHATARANKAIQLGEGDNAIANTLQVFDYQLLNASGKIPDERLSNKVVLLDASGKIPVDNLPEGIGGSGGSSDTNINKELHQINLSFIYPAYSEEVNFTFQIWLTEEDLNNYEFTGVLDGLIEYLRNTTDFNGDDYYISGTTLPINAITCTPSGNTIGLRFIAYSLEYDNVIFSFIEIQNGSALIFTVDDLEIINYEFY